MISVAAAIIVDKDKVLITKRNPNMKIANVWEFPGGKLEIGETLEECVVREIEEELALSIKVKNYYTTVQNEVIELSAYLSEIIGGNFELREHSDFAWVDVKELKNYDFASADKKIAIKLEQTGLN
jgi:mutator protein MutT